MSGVDLVGWQTVTTEYAGVLLAVWGKGTAALLPAMKSRWLRVDECRHDILRFIARVILLNLACKYHRGVVTGLHACSFFGRHV